jgi:hypothetical protein
MEIGQELRLDHDQDAEARHARGVQPSLETARVPEGMLRAYECYAPAGSEVVGISIWDSPESRNRFRLSETEKERRQAMEPFVVDENSGFYVGRELKIPGR